MHAPFRDSHVLDRKTPSSILIIGFYTLGSEKSAYASDEELRLGAWFSLSQGGAASTAQHNIIFVINSFLLFFSLFFPFLSFPFDAIVSLLYSSFCSFPGNSNLLGCVSSAPLFSVAGRSRFVSFGSVYLVDNDRGWIPRSGIISESITHNPEHRRRQEATGGGREG